MTPGRLLLGLSEIVHLKPCLTQSMYHNKCLLLLVDVTLELITEVSWKIEITQRKALGLSIESIFSGVLIYQGSTITDAY